MNVSIDILICLIQLCFSFYHGLFLCIILNYPPQDTGMMSGPGGERDMWCVRPNGSSWERSRNLGLMMRLLLCLHWHTQVSWGRDSGESEHYYGVTAKHYVCQNKLGGIFCQFFKLTKILIFYTSLACVPWSLTRLIAILVTDYVKPTVTSM